MREWIDAGLSLFSRRRRQLRGMRNLVAEYEAEYGAFSDEELEAARKRSCAAADEVRAETKERTLSHESRA